MPVGAESGLWAVLRLPTLKAISLSWEEFCVLVQKEDILSYSHIDTIYYRLPNEYQEQADALIETHRTPHEVRKHLVPRNLSDTAWPY